MNETTMEQDPTDVEHHIEGMLLAESRISAVGLTGQSKSTFLPCPYRFLPFLQVLVHCASRLPVHQV